MIALDTETTGVDFYHGARPYFVTVCREDGTQTWWEWDVEPLTREPIIPTEDLTEIRGLMEAQPATSEDEFVLQNAKFDAAALASVLPGLKWLWGRTHDTLLAGHLLASNQPHDLTSMAYHYLGRPGKIMDNLEKALEEACKEARRVVQQAKLRKKRGSKPKKVKAKASRGLFGSVSSAPSVLVEAEEDDPLANWRIAEAGLEDMPSAKEKSWKIDGWLPRALAKHLSYWAGLPLVVSGGQNGVDQAALKTARLTGLATGWVVPLGWRTLDGPAGWLADYGLVEDSSPDYKPRTWRNVAETSATLVVYENSHSPGEICTRNAVRFHGKPCKEVNLCRKPDPKDVAQWIIESVPGSLNVTGNSERTCPGIGERAKRFLTEVFRHAAPHRWWTVLRDYANADSTVTLALWRVMKELLKKQDLWDIYLESRKLLPVVHGMEYRGATYLDGPAAEVRKQYETRIVEAKGTCLRVAKERNYDLEIPKGSVNGSLRTFCFDVLDLPRVRNPKAKTTAPSMDSKNAFPVWLETLPEGSDRLEFVKALADYRDLGTGLSFLDAYERFKVPHPTLHGISVLHGNLNPTGTDTLRFTMNNPNLQQVSKKKKTNQRRCFGPAPGREWYSLDYENLELRIPTFEANEPELVEVFLHPERPPFYGSYHMVVFSALWPELWEKALQEHKETGAAAHCKDQYGDGPYQWTKNFDFGVIYGCMETTGDRTAHKKGAWQANRERFPKIAQLSDYWIAFAEKRGYVETMPDKTVNPRRGYPLLCSRTDWGKISPTVPLNYHVSGTAMWCTRKAMVRCQEQLDVWNAAGNGQYFLALQVHDEMVFDFPAGGRKNLPKVLRLKLLMEQSGEDIGVPLTVSCSWHRRSWAEKEKLPKAT